MKEPKQRQRFPTNGNELYLKMVEGFQPVFVTVYMLGDLNKQQYEAGFLRINPGFDPVLYFWPVDGQHVVVYTHDIESEFMTRLNLALKRDGAVWTSIFQPKEDHFIQKNIGDAEKFFNDRNPKALSV